MSTIQVETANLRMTALDVYFKPKRQAILDRIVEILEGIEEIKYVSENFNIKHPQEIDTKKLPACFPIDDSETRSVLSLFDDDDDMQSELTIIITTVLFDRKGETAKQRSDIMRLIEKAVVNDSTLTTMLLEQASPTIVTTDRGYFGNYSVFDQEFKLLYTYRHQEGG